MAPMKQKRVPFGAAAPKSTSKGESTSKFGTMGTFAGYRPPVSPQKRCIFDAKVKLWKETQAELDKAYPGRVVLLHRSASQSVYWKFMQGELKGTKGFKAQQKATAKAAAKWKELLAAACAEERDVLHVPADHLVV